MISGTAPLPQIQVEQEEGMIEGRKEMEKGVEKGHIRSLGLINYCIYIR